MVLKRRHVSLFGTAHVISTVVVLVRRRVRTGSHRCWSLRCAEFVVLGTPCEETESVSPRHWVGQRGHDLARLWGLRQCNRDLVQPRFCYQELRRVPLDRGCPFLSFVPPPLCELFTRLKGGCAPPFESVMATVGRMVFLTFGVCMWEERAELRLVGLFQ